MAYAKTNFATYEDLRPATDDQLEPDDATMRKMVHQECGILFEMLSKIISTYASSHQDTKLRVFFEMVEDGLNQSIDILSQGYQGIPRAPSSLIRSTPVNRGDKNAYGPEKLGFFPSGGWRF